MKTLIALLSVCGIAQAEGWSYDVIEDDFDGTRAHVLSTQSIDPVTDFSGAPAKASLELRCDDDGAAPYWRLVWPTLLETHIEHVQILGFVDKSSMQLRFDDGRVYGPGSLVGGWPPDPPAATHQAVSTAAVRPILRNALKADRMMVRDIAWDGTTLTVAFDLSGLAAGVDTLGEHCRRL